MDRGEACAAKEGVTSIPGAGAGRRILAQQDRVRQVDGGVVREERHGEVGQFLSGAHDVKAGSDALAGLVQERPVLSRAPGVGGAGIHGAHAQRTAPGVVEAEEGSRRRGVLARIRLKEGPLIRVDQKAAVVEESVHHSLERLGLGALDAVHPDTTQPGVPYLDAYRRPLRSTASGRGDSVATVSSAVQEGSGAGFDAVTTHWARPSRPASDSTHRPTSISWPSR